MPTHDKKYFVFDADNHMYETPEAFTRYLPERVRGLHQVRPGQRTHEDRREQRDQRLHPEPHLRGRRRAGRPGGVLQGRQPRGQVPPRDHGQGRSRPIPAMPAPGRASSCSTSWASTERSCGRPWPACSRSGSATTPVRCTRPSTRSTAGWLEEWTYNFDNRMFATPVIHLGILEEAQRELDFVMENGAKIILVRPAPAWGLDGSALVRRCPSSTRSGSACRGGRPPRRACTPPTAATSAT